MIYNYQVVYMCATAMAAAGARTYIYTGFQRELNLLKQWHIYIRVRMRMGFNFLRMQLLVLNIYIYSI